jgi:hypothetical protein
VIGQLRQAISTATSHQDLARPDPNQPERDPLAQRHGAKPETKRSCQPANSELASPFGHVIKLKIRFQLAKQLGHLPLFSPGDELLKGSGEGRFLGGLSTHPEGSIEQLLVESKIRGHGYLQCGEFIH